MYQVVTVKTGDKRKMVMKTKEQARANFEASVAYIPARYEAGIDLADLAS